MRTQYIILAVATVFFSFFTGVKTASAATVDFSDASVYLNMGALDYGQSGTITGHGGGTPYYNWFAANVKIAVGGTLPSNSMVTFSYNFDTSVGPLFDTSNLAVSAFNNSGVFVGTPSNLQPDIIFVSADLNKIDGTGTTFINNLSDEMVTFTSSFAGAVRSQYPDRHDAYTISYEVSPVPLPAALPLFGFPLFFT